MTEFSNRINYLLKKHHKGNGSEMARDLGMKHNTLVSKWSKGKSDFSKKYASAICKQYGVTQKWLRGDEPLESEKQQQEPKPKPDQPANMIPAPDYYELRGRYNEIKEQFERNQDRMLLVLESIETKLAPAPVQAHDEETPLPEDRVKQDPNDAFIMAHHQLRKKHRTPQQQGQTDLENKNKDTETIHAAPPVQ